MWGSEKCVQNFIGNCEGKRPLQRPRCGWEGSVKTDWIHVISVRD